ncbi:MAG: DUF2029 domain-containing protein [Acidobacteria bacterium]|nr:DUF2029 domain-containing protein [Acidobacteriota bacterium]
MSRLRAAATVAVVVLLGAAVYTTKAARKMPDFEVYWTAGVRARAAEPLYRAEDEHYQLKYLPAFAVLAIPVGLLPLPTAKAMWFAASIVLMIALVRLSIALLPTRLEPAWLLAIIATVAMGKFYGHELVLGQVNLLLGVLVVVAALALRARREAAAGALFALAIVVKPYAAIILPWLIARRRPASLAAAAAGVIAALLVPASLYGLAGNFALHRDWWRTVSDSTAPNLLSPDNVSTAAMFAKWIGAGTRAAWLAIATSVVLLACAALVFAKRRTVVSTSVLHVHGALDHQRLLSRGDRRALSTQAAQSRLISCWCRSFSP